MMENPSSSPVTGSHVLNFFQPARTRLVKTLHLHSTYIMYSIRWHAIQWYPAPTSVVCHKYSSGQSRIIPYFYFSKRFFSNDEVRRSSRILSFRLSSLGTSFVIFLIRFFLFLLGNLIYSLPKFLKLDPSSWPSSQAQDGSTTSWHHLLAPLRNI